MHIIATIVVMVEEPEYKIFTLTPAIYLSLSQIYAHSAPSKLMVVAWVAAGAVSRSVPVAVPGASSGWLWVDVLCCADIGGESSGRGMGRAALMPIDSSLYLHLQLPRGR